MKLEVLIGINGEEPRLARGSCTRTLMESLGYDPDYFREQGNLVTSWRWVASHDGRKSDAPPEEVKKKPRISAKRLNKLDQKWSAWSN